MVNSNSDNFEKEGRNQNDNICYPLNQKVIDYNPTFFNDDDSGRFSQQRGLNTIPLESSLILRFY